jgi:hypothetical protein
MFINFINIVNAGQKFAFYLIAKIFLLKVRNMIKIPTMSAVFNEI